MQRIEYAELRMPAEDGRPLALSYFVVAERDREGVDHYGVRVVERFSDDQTEVLDITVREGRIYELARLLLQNAVTPTTLQDVVNDWL